MSFPVYIRKKKKKSKVTVNSSRENGKTENEKRELRLYYLVMLFTLYLNPIHWFVLTLEPFPPKTNVREI